MVCAKVTNRLVVSCYFRVLLKLYLTNVFLKVAHMTKSEMEYLDWGLIGPMCLFLNQYFNNFLPEYLVLWFCLIWCTIDLGRYCSQVSLGLNQSKSLYFLKCFTLQKVCLEICDHLNIHLFKIPYPPKPLMHHASVGVHTLHRPPYQNNGTSSSSASQSSGSPQQVIGGGARKASRSSRSSKQHWTGTSSNIESRAHQVSTLPPPLRSWEKP